MVVAAVAGPRSLDLDRVVQELIRDALDLGRHRGGEEQGLAGERHELADPLDIRDETHVEHAIGLVDDKEFDAAEQKLAALEMVEQAAGRGDQDIDAAGDLGILVPEGHAADEERDRQAALGAVAGKVFLHLCRKLARRLQDEGARHSRPGATLLQQGQHRQSEGGGLARAGLGNAQHVAALHDMWDRLGLNGRGRRVAGRLHGGENFWGKSEVGKAHCLKDGPKEAVRIERQRAARIAAARTRRGKPGVGRNIVPIEGLSIAPRGSRTR